MASDHIYCWDCLRLEITGSRSHRKAFYLRARGESRASSKATLFLIFSSMLVLTREIRALTTPSGCMECSSVCLLLSGEITWSSFVAPSYFRVWCSVAESTEALHAGRSGFKSHLGIYLYSTVDVVLNPSLTSLQRRTCFVGSREDSRNMGSRLACFHSGICSRGICSKVTSSVTFCARNTKRTGSAGNNTFISVPCCVTGRWFSLSSTWIRL